MSRDLCGNCMRPIWDPSIDGSISIDVCTGWKSDRCQLVKNNRDLGTALALLLREPNSEIVRESARALLRVVDPAVITHRCPHCDSPYVVRDSRIVVHYARPADSRVCPLSFKSRNQKGEWI